MIINSILLFGVMNLMEIPLMRASGILRLEMETGDGEMESINTTDKKMHLLKMANLSLKLATKALEVLTIPRHECKPGTKVTGATGR